ncbi:hypothetical protein HM1_1650 [Heliomicrobium modesticaldum Ice1]|uniref:Uncharacterized protein n=1 Tax=Heliobacterium modesticaldum (strain ATCC 51547 / Ice1) TaxID=498761 RepID=B0TE25_HELMI|nr:hypothetical protein HM1_1650 [Heliomicrobium modesticaldum Ice1]
MFRFDVDPQVSFYDFAALWDQLVPADSVFRLFRELAPPINTTGGFYRSLLP